MSLARATLQTLPSPPMPGVHPEAAPDFIPAGFAQRSDDGASRSAVQVVYAERRPRLSGPELVARYQPAGHMLLGRQTLLPPLDGTRSRRGTPYKASARLRFALLVGLVVAAATVPIIAPAL